MIPAMPVLSRPDTVYFFGQVQFTQEFAEKINAALLQVMDPNARNWIARIEQYLATLDPINESIQRSRPFHELVEAVRENDRASSLVEDGEKFPKISTNIAGRHFALVPFSPRRGCNFMLQMDGQTVHGRISDPSNLPNIYLEIGSAPFWTCSDWRKFLIDWKAWLREITRGQARWRVSRLDSAFHTQSIQAEDLDRENFVCKATTHRRITKAHIIQEIEKAVRKDNYARENDMPAENLSEVMERLHVENETWYDDWFKGGRPQQVSWGQRQWIYCRAYNKTAEILHKKDKRVLFERIYRDHNYNPELDVINVEFQMSRAWLTSRELKDITNDRSVIIDDLDDLITHYDVLTSYLVGCSEKTVMEGNQTFQIHSENKGWLRMIQHNRTRLRDCNTAHAWELIREATDLLPHLRSAERQRNRVRRSSSAWIADGVRVGAQMDAMMGRPIKSSYGQKDLIETMAELISLHCPYSLLELQARYNAERARNTLHRFDENKPEGTTALLSA